MMRAANKPAAFLLAAAAILIICFILVLGCHPGQKDSKNTGVRHLEMEWQGKSYHCISWKDGYGGGLWCEKEN